MIIGLIDNHSPALTPQEMSDFDQMDSVGDYSGDEVRFFDMFLSYFVKRCCSTWRVAINLEIYFVTW